VDDVDEIEARWAELASTGLKDMPVVAGTAGARWPALLISLHPGWAVELRVTEPDLNAKQSVNQAKEVIT